MKRAFLPLLLALMLLTLPALSLARDYPAYAVVNNPNPQDRLHLREAPSADSASLGKYFNGVFAYVLLDDTAPNGWLHVRIGNAPGAFEGYMKEEYLLRDPANVEFTSAMPTLAIQQSNGADLYPDRTGQSQSLGAFQQGVAVTVLGFDKEWYHVQLGGLTGFMRASAFNYALTAQE